MRNDHSELSEESRRRVRDPRPTTRDPHPVSRTPTAPRRGPFDFQLFLATLALVSVGIIFVFDASYARALTSREAGFDGLYLAKRQLGSAIAGGVLLGLMLLPRTRRLGRSATTVLAISLFLLVSVHFVGHRSHGATSWLRILGFSFQPSEGAKLALVIWLAWYLAGRSRAELSELRGLVVPLLPVMVVLGLVILEHDMGTAFTIAVPCLGLLFLAGARKRHLLYLVGVATLVMAGLIFQQPHALRRFKAWHNPIGTAQEEGYQVVQALVGIGSGGVLGAGLGEGRQKFWYLPASTAATDSIFVVIAEETGLVGSLALLGLFFWFTCRCWLLARRTRDRFSFLLANGLTMLIVFQALLNLAVVTNLMPTTGVPLPFISYGGSSLVFSLVAVGLLLNLSRREPEPLRSGQPR